MKNGLASAVSFNDTTKGGPDLRLGCVWQIKGIMGEHWKICIAKPKQKKTRLQTGGCGLDGRT